jgi:hypothetical protein
MAVHRGYTLTTKVHKASGDVFVVTINDRTLWHVTISIGRLPGDKQWRALIHVTDHYACVGWDSHSPWAALAVAIHVLIADQQDIRTRVIRRKLAALERSRSRHHPTVIIQPDFYEEGPDTA